MDWTQIIIASISSITTILSVYLGKVFVDRRRQLKRDPIKEDLETNRNIILCLDFILDQTGADRAYIMQFHNGGYYVSGRSQQKFSCSHEVCSLGTSREASKSQNHLISNFHDYIDALINKGEYYYSDTQYIKDETLKNLVLSKGVESLFNVPLKTLDGKIIGILGVDFVKDKADPIYSKSDKLEIRSVEQMKEHLRTQGRILSAYLI